MWEGEFIFQDSLKGDRSMHGIGPMWRRSLDGARREFWRAQADLSGPGIYLAATNTYKKTTGRRRAGFGDAELTLLCATCERTRGCVIFLRERELTFAISIDRGCDWNDRFNTGCPRWNWGNLNCCHDWGETTRRSKGWVNRHG